MAKKNAEELRIEALIRALTVLQKNATKTAKSLRQVHQELEDDFDRQIGRVRPVPGSVLHCSLGIVAEYTGIYIGRN